MAWHNGDVYVGLWEQGHENGVGKLTKKNNDVFDGVFVNGKLDGEVVIHYADGTRFRGTFRNGLREEKPSRRMPRACALRAATTRTSVMDLLWSATRLVPSRRRAAMRMARE